MEKSLVTVATYRDLPNALLAKGQLQASGMACFLGNENLVRLDWLLANAVGGIRLQVHAKDAAKAVELLESGIPAVFFTERGEIFTQPQCPSCDSLRISYQDRNRWVTFLSWLVLSFPLPFPKKLMWVCQNCGHEWKEEKEEQEAVAAD